MIGLFANSSAQARVRGFTLIEVVVSLVIASIIVGMTAMLVSAPVDRYIEQSRRTELIDASTRITDTLTRDLQAALPNSVRIQNFPDTSVLQMLEVTDTVYYEVEPATPTAAEALRALRFQNPPETNFSAYGDFTHTQANTFLVVNHTGQAGQDAYSLSDVITRNAVPNGGPFGTKPVVLAPAFRFTNGPSPTNRMFAVRGAITYICDRLGGNLLRYENHAPAANVPANSADPQLHVVAEIVATGVTACSLACNVNAGSMACLNTLTFSARLTRGIAPDDDRLTLLHQFRVENTP